MNCAMMQEGLGIITLYARVYRRMANKVLFDMQCTSGDHSHE